MSDYLKFFGLVILFGILFLLLLPILVVIGILFLLYVHRYNILLGILLGLFFIYVGWVCYGIHLLLD